MPVIDASLVIRLLANRGVDDLLRWRMRSAGHVHAPDLIDAEVANAIRGLVRGGKIAVNRAIEMLQDFAELRIVRHPLTPYLRRVFELRNNLTAYDAFYVALAENLEAPLLTRDKKFSGASGHNADVQVYP
jgi:predicted nucleic acid-binding protein